VTRTLIRVLWLSVILLLLPADAALACALSSGAA
jgi:hypothetical protein